MKQVVFVLSLLLLIGFASASVATFPFEVNSDTSTQWNKKGVWMDSVLYTPHPAWTTEIPDASWVWKRYPVSEKSANKGETVKFQKEFYVPACEAGEYVGTIDISADNTFLLKLNDVVVGKELKEFTYMTKHTYDISPFLKEGSNIFAIKATNMGNGQTPDLNPAAIIFHANIDCVEDDNEVPEFGPFALLIAVAGGLLIMSKR